MLLSGAKLGRVPGEAGVWVLICGELFVFSAFFLMIATYRHQQPQVFAASQAHLNHGIGLANTLLLLTSSLFVALGVRRVRDGRAGASRFFGLALGCSAGFVTLKLIEYSGKILIGITPVTNDFYMYYFAFTGIHLIHVLIGSAILAYIAITSRRRETPAQFVLIAECGAIFWHLVDLLWIVLFALFYLASAGRG